MPEFGGGGSSRGCVPSRLSEHADRYFRVYGIVCHVGIGGLGVHPLGCGVTGGGFNMRERWGARSWCHRDDVPILELPRPAGLGGGGGGGQCHRTK